MESFGADRVYTHAYEGGHPDHDAVALALAWLVLMIVTALGADFLVPYSITALDLKARLAPVRSGPVRSTGGAAASTLGKSASSVYTASGLGISRTVISVAMPKHPSLLKGRLGALFRRQFLRA